MENWKNAVIYILCGISCVIFLGFNYINKELAREMDLGPRGTISKRLACPGYVTPLHLPAGYVYKFEEDPFSPGTVVSVGGRTKWQTNTSFYQDVYIFEKRYWTEEADVAYCEKIMNDSLQHRLNVRLRTHIDSKKIIGWDTEKTAKAFGEPAKKENVYGYERWIYYPWEEQGTWSVSVYMLDGKIDHVKGD
jgi:hypothetical protein